MINDIYIVPNHSGPAEAIEIDESLCIGCNSCADICRIQTILPSPDKGKPPVVAYPEECWYCGCCVEACQMGALKMHLPIGQRVLFKDRETGQIFRLDTDEAPQKSYFRAPYGYMDHPELEQIIKLLEDKDSIPVMVLSDECAVKIGRFFGEKDQKDNTDKLIGVLRMIGFNDIIKISYGHKINETKRKIISVDIKTENEDFHLEVSELAMLIKRICVSSSSAVEVWNSVCN